MADGDLSGNEEIAGLAHVRGDWAWFFPDQHQEYT
jgi:hypothetical protein